MHFAAQSDNVAIAQLLLTAGAPVLDPDKVSSADSLHNLFSFSASAVTCLSVHRLM